MNTQFVAYKSMDDLVFENRNVGYGAYILRKEYSNRLFTSVIIAFGIISLALTAPGFLKGEKTVVKDVVSGPTTTLDEAPLIIVPPAQPLKASPPPSAPRADLVPVVTDTRDDTELFTNADLALPNMAFDATGGITGGFDPNAFDFTAGVENGTTIAKVDTFVRVENMPEFNGDLSKFLAKHLRFPEAALKAGLDGKVYLSFVIGTDGSIGNVQVLKGISRELDEEAVRVVKKMPNWKPGRQSGRAVPVRFSLPIVFVMQN